MNLFDHYYFSNELQSLPQGTIDQIGWLVSQRRIRGLDQRPQLIITRQVSEAKKLHRIISTHTPTTPCAIFSDYETLPYDQTSPNPSVMANRHQAIMTLLTEPVCIVIVAIQTLHHLIPEKDFTLSQSWHIEVGMVLPRNTLIEKLVACGYQQVSQVSCEGEFAVRGGMIDVFMQLTESPMRIEYFDDTIDCMYYFDEETQLSTEKIKRFICENLRDINWPCDKKLILENYKKLCGDLPKKTQQQLDKLTPPNGYQYALPLYHKSLCSLLSYLPTTCTISVIGNIEEESLQYFALLNRRFSEHSLTALTPESITLPYAEIMNLVQQRQSILQNQDVIFGDTAQDTIANQIKLYNNYKAIVYCSSKARAQISARQFKVKHPDTQHVEKPVQIQHLENMISVICAEPLNDFIIPSKHILISSGGIAKKYSDGQKKTKNKLTSLDVSHLVEGQLVIHESYGLGKYIGLSTEIINQHPHELIHLEYAKNSHLSVAMDQIHLLTIYQGPLKALDQPGHKKWQTKLKKAKENIEKVALEMAQYQSERNQAKSIKCTQSEDYAAFCSQFLFEPTESQQDCFHAVEQDMSSDRPMERLICGDVGFGKTEIAMRAACLTVMNGAQVVILAPTTILAQQHYNNLTERFINQPIHIAYLSRQTSEKDKKRTIEEINSGQVDILVATHLGTSQKIKLKKLGLLIIDEEHKFGVNVKQHWLRSYPGAHRLMLSATPIPRTLNQALSKLYDINLMSTPPKGRHKISVSVREYDTDLMAEAVLRETNRGGQVYCVVNKIKDIPRYMNDIKQNFPNLNVVSAHGQMPTAKLEQIMFDFQRCHYDVMVCTTIIESGIDIANANTIMIMNADHFGLAQLHQLRGRVGRSHQQAYACLFINDRRASTSDAVARLDALLRHDEIGSGASLAMEDLEIRGAGHILGKDQSGHVDAIGLSLYSKLIDASYNKVLTNQIETDINLDVDAFICERLIPDKITRLQLYQNIYQANTLENMNDIEVELTQKYHNINDALYNLLELQKIKILSNKARIKSITQEQEYAEVIFNENSSINHDQLFKLVKDQNKSMHFTPPNAVRIKVMANEIQHITNMLETIID